MFLLGLIAGLVIASSAAAWVAIDQIKRQTRRAREAEGRERSSRRLAEIGAMTGGLAHEIKNPLSTIGLNAQLLAEGIADLQVDDLDKGRLIRRIDNLRREVERLRDTLGDFLKFAGNVRMEPKPADVNAVVEELADFYMPQAAHRSISLRADLAPGPLRANLDVGHFKQALLNLMINATQAIEDEARAASGVEPPPATVKPREILLRTLVPKPRKGERETVEVHVTDTGPGIPAQTLESIFTPYFTTKSGGSGLGLPTAKRLIEEHEGTLRVFTEMGKGTDFVIGLPRVK
jgi:signal transduction histidine kinase